MKGKEQLPIQEQGAILAPVVKAGHCLFGCYEVKNPLVTLNSEIYGRAGNKGIC